MPDKKPRVRFDDPKKQHRHHSGFRTLVHKGRTWEWRIHRLSDPTKGILEIRWDGGKIEHEVALRRVEVIGEEGYEGDWEYYYPGETVYFRVSFSPKDVIGYLPQNV